MENISAYMTTQELASRLGLKPGTIRKYRRERPDKLPPSYNFLGQPRYKRSEVEAWEEAHKEICRDGRR